MKLKNKRSAVFGLWSLFSLCFSAFVVNSFAQETPPAPSAPKSVNIPAVKERKLPNNLTIAVVERKNVPLVTVQLLVKSGASSESADKAGLADMTASLLTKGTKTRTATQIAEQIEFLGGSINTGAGWNNSVVSINVMADKLDRAMEIMSDVVLNPSFKQEEIDLLRSQSLDGLTYNLKQPGFLANYVAAKYSFDEHPAGGTPETLKSITNSDITVFHKTNYLPSNAILIFTGEITDANADALAKKYFGNWNNQSAAKTSNSGGKSGNVNSPNSSNLVRRILVVDLPNSGQASVNYGKNIGSNGRGGKSYYPATVLNSLLGGGYSSRLNQEIRIKRGLSYGAGSSFAWRADKSNFGTRTQTKNESAAEVAELVLAEVKRLTEGSIADSELSPRKSVLTGGFGRNLETTQGLAAAVADLYSFGLSTAELNSYMKNVETVKDAQIRDFAKANLLGGDIIIVGDYAKFKDDLAKRFPNMKIEVVKAA
ncbi:MAG TPA: pitrilysin family protein [Pyrinomonadaceae bacterium]